jgi:hypothetical protein
MKNPTLLSTAVVSGPSAEVDVPTSAVTKSNRNIRHETASLLGIGNEPVPDLTPHAPMEGDAHTGQDHIRGGGHSSWTSAPALMVNPVSVPTSSVPSNSPFVAARNRQTTSGPSRSIIDLIKAYSSDKGKYSGEDQEQSLRMVRRTFFSSCKLMYVTSDEALQAAHLPLTASALEYY